MVQKGEASGEVDWNNVLSTGTKPSSALITRVFLLHIRRFVRYKLSTPTHHPMGILPHSSLYIAGKLASVSSNLQQAPGNHEPDGPLTHSHVLEEGHPHFLPPRAIKVHFLQYKEEQECFWLVFNAYNELSLNSLTRKLSAIQSKPAEDVSLLLCSLDFAGLGRLGSPMLGHTPPAPQPGQSLGSLRRGGLGNMPDQQTKALTFCDSLLLWQQK